VVPRRRFWSVYFLRHYCISTQKIPQEADGNRRHSSRRKNGNAYWKVEFIIPVNCLLRFPGLEARMDQERSIQHRRNAPIHKILASRFGLVYEVRSPLHTTDILHPRSPRKKCYFPSRERKLYQSGDFPRADGQICKKPEGL
jgi:hypothetical protein